MTQFSTLETLATPNRRGMLKGVGVLSAGAVLMLAGVKANAQSASGDVAILNVALGLEHEAINAYQIGAMSGLLQKPVLDVADIAAALEVPVEARATA